MRKNSSDNIVSYEAPEYRVIIAGTRTFSDYSAVRRAMGQVFRDRDCRNIVIISGGCQGADRLGEQFAARDGMKCVRFPADWKTYGKAAGPIRNRKMAEYAAENGCGILVAFWDGEGRGTKSMIQLAKEEGLEVYVFRM